MPARRRSALRARLTVAVIEGMFRTVSRLGALHPRARLDRHGVEKLADRPYAERDGRTLAYDVYRPIGVTPGERRPVVFYVHGGGFAILSKETHWIMGLAFAKRGFVVVSIDYRLAPMAPFPLGLEDVADAYLHMLDHVGELGGDPSKVIVAGESAGANLAVALTIAATTRRSEPFAAKVFERGVVPCAVLPACGIFDVTDVARFTREPPAVTPFVQGRLDGIERAYFRGRAASSLPEEQRARELADVLAWARSSTPTERPWPPTFVLCGTADPILRDSLALVSALRARGADAEEQYYPREFHAFHAFPSRPEARRAWADTFDFLARHGLSPAPARAA